MSCKHPSVIVNPGTIIPEGDGFIIGDLESGTMLCRECEIDLPIEDLQFYPEGKVSIAIPVEMMHEADDE